MPNTSTKYKHNDYCAIQHHCRPTKEPDPTIYRKVNPARTSIESTDTRQKIRIDSCSRMSLVSLYAKALRKMILSFSRCNTYTPQLQPVHFGRTSHVDVFKIDDGANIEH